jgi:hypothetical protein
MDSKLQAKLYAKYKKIFKQKDLSPQETCMCWGISIGDGWFNLMDRLCLNIQGHIDNAKKYKSYHKNDDSIKLIEQVEATQVKQKFGGLRFYVSGGDDYIDGLISMAESLSYMICEQCGNLGAPNTQGWIKVLCRSCRITENRDLK